MKKRKKPRYAPGQELTLHPGDNPRTNTPEDPDEPETSDPEALDDSLKMEVAEEPVPDLRRAPAGAPPFAPDRETYPDTEGVLLVAIFADMTGAQSCADDLERRELGVAVTLLAPHDEGTEPARHTQQSGPREAGMGRGVAVGASIGATAGLLAATYFIPQFGTTLVQAPSLLTTIAGAGLGSFLGGLADYGAGGQKAGAASGTADAQVAREGVLLLARTDREDAERVRRLIEFWNPVEVRVQ